jgi:hypothetical protein
MNTILHISQIFWLIAMVTLIWLAIRAFKRNILWGLAVLLLSPLGALVFGIRHWNDEKKPLSAYFTSFGTALVLSLYVFTAWGGWGLVRTALKVHQGIQTQALDDRDAYAFMHANLRFIENASPDEYDRRKIEMMRKFINEHEQGMSNTSRNTLLDEVTELMRDRSLSKQQRNELEAIRIRLANAGTINHHQPETVVTVETPQTNKQKPLSMRPSTTRVRYRTDYLEIDVSEAKNYVGKSFKVTRKNSGERECRLISTSPGKLLFEQRGGGGTFTFEYRHRDIEKLKLLARID